MTLPNFLLIGAAKSGTTSLYKYMRQHPQIYMPKLKEPGFFNLHGTAIPPSPSLINEISDYRKLFAGITDELAFGEATPTYLASPWAPLLIKEMIPNVKMITILRNPVERAWSHHIMHLNMGASTFSTEFQQAIAETITLKKGDQSWEFGYLSLGMYCQQLKKYYALFDQTQIHVILYEELIQNIDDVLRKIFVFLNVDESFQADTRILHHTSHAIRSKMYAELFDPQATWISLLHRVLPAPLVISLTSKLRRLNLRQHKPPLPQSARSQLRTYYKQEIDDLQKLLGTDLSTWLA